MDGPVVAIALVVYAIILWVLLFYAWHRGFKEWRSNRATRVTRHSARVMDRREAMPSAAGPEATPSVQYLVLFEFDSRQKEFEVDADTYGESRVGREGLLLLRGGSFEAFEPASEDQRADDVYRRVVGS